MAGGNSSRSSPFSASRRATPWKESRRGFLSNPQNKRSWRHHRQLHHIPCPQSIPMNTATAIYAQNSDLSTQAITDLESPPLQPESGLDTHVGKVPGDPLQPPSSDTTEFAVTDEVPKAGAGPKATSLQIEKYECRRSAHRQKVYSSTSTRVSQLSSIDIVGDDDIVAVVDEQSEQFSCDASIESLEEEEQRELHSCFGSHAETKPELPAPPEGQDAMVALLDAEQKFIRQRYGSPLLVPKVKHTEPDELLVLRRFRGTSKVALLGFLTRYGRNDWMKDQHFYTQKAALAAAHMQMAVWRSHGLEVDYPGQRCNLRLSTFDGDDFLNCGWAKKTQQGGRYFFKCKQPEYCPSCNRWLRVESAKKEFLPAFKEDSSWFSITVAGTSNPARAGVKMFVGYEDGKAVYEPLVMLSEFVTWPKLPKFDSQCEAPWMLAAGLYDLLNWLIAGHYFDGLHVAGENSFTYFPDRLSPVGVGHTVNPHYHAYGNTARPFDRRRAMFMLRGALEILRREGGNRLWTYPDIALRPVTTPDEMVKAISYTFKAWPFAQHYIRALSRGCPVEGLNLEFHTTYFGSDELLHPFPSPNGLTKYGAKLGNMSQKAGGKYIGKPLPKLMSPQQVQRFQDRLARNEFSPWEAFRYDQHLQIVGRQRQLRVRQESQEMEIDILGQP